jgi:hypothetical protein
MPTLADLHVHVYPTYDYSLLFNQIFDRFNLITNKNNLKVDNFLIALTEREDCNFYEELKTSKIELPANIKKIINNDCITLIKDSQELHIFPGRQINTKEKIELLSLGSDFKIPSKLDFSETLQLIKSHNAVPVINWAPGKWWFERGQIIKKILIERNDLILCDTSLRPLGYPKPKLMKLAEKRDIKIIYGSDPLPHSLEQNNIAKYLTYYKANLEPNNASFRDLLLNNQGTPIGTRSSLIELFLRLKRYYKNK